MEHETEIAGLLAAAGVASDLADRLGTYGALLLDATGRTNLTGAKSPQEVANHVLDSVALAPYVAESLIDVGSGGGLPGIPLAIVSGVETVLVEAARKKCDFLRSVLLQMSIAGEVLCGRAESIGRQVAFRERFATGTARAVSHAPTVMELLAPLLQIGGLAVLQRGEMGERERNAVSDAAPMLGLAVEQEIEQPGGRRRLLLLRKRTPTPDRYPRRDGVPERRPLCW